MLLKVLIPHNPDLTNELKPPLLLLKFRAINNLWENRLDERIA